MLREVVYRGVDAGPRVGEALERCIQRLAKQASRFDSEATFLRVVLASPARGPLFSVSARLTVPGGVLFGREERSDPVVAIRRAFSDLLEQLQRHASHRRREHVRDRVRKTATVLAEQIAEKAAHEVRVLEPLTTEQIERLQRFIRRELFYRRLEGRMPFGIAAESILDDTVVLALEEADLKPEKTPYEPWLLALARRAMDGRSSSAPGGNGAQAAVEWDAVEAGILPPPSEDDFLSFFQPDEDPSVGDVTPDASAPSPESALARRELYAHIHRILRQLPESWRHAFTLCTIEGFPVPSIASSLSVTPEDVRRQVQMAMEFLREKLRETGYRASKAGGLAGGKSAAR